MSMCARDSDGRPTDIELYDLDMTRLRECKLELRLLARRYVAGGGDRELYKAAIQLVAEQLEHNLQPICAALVRKLEIK